MQHINNNKSLMINNLNTIHNNNEEYYITDLESIKKSVHSLDDYLKKIISERLLKLERTVFSLFGQISSENKNNIQLMPVEELATQLDLQKVNFEAEIRKTKLKANELEKLLAHTKDNSFKEKQAAIDEKEKILIILGKFLQKESVVNELRNELKKEFGAKLKNENNNNNIILSADKHLNLNNYLPDMKYDKQTSKYEKKLHCQNEKLGEGILKSILEYKSIDDMPSINENEIPDFMKNKEEELLEEKLGFGYEELLRLYRNNTKLNIELSFIKWENNKLNKLLSEISQPIQVNYNIIQNEKNKPKNDINEIKLKLKYSSLISKIKASKLEYLKFEGYSIHMKLIDKYRLEMYRDLKKTERINCRNLREEKFEICRQKKMIKKLFEQTKLKASFIISEANEQRLLVKTEIEEYSNKKHEMLLAKAKYFSFMNKNKIEMEENIINAEIIKHIEIYKQHLEDEANEKASEELNEELENEKEILIKQFNEKIEEINDDIEKERIQYEKEIKHLKNELKTTQNRYDEIIDTQKKYIQRTNEIRKEKSNLNGQLKESQLLYKELENEFNKYKKSNTGNNNNQNNIIVNNTKVNINPQSLFIGYLEPSQELQKARELYKQMRMKSDESTQQIKRLLREKQELCEENGRLTKMATNLNELIQKRDLEMIELQSTFDNEIIHKLRPFIKLIETIGRDVLHNAPTNYIFNYKKQDFAELEGDLYRDKSDWYIHKNHILRCFFFSIEEWFRDHFWLHERIVQCNSSVHEAMQQVLKDTWMETRIQTHAFIRWFGDLDNEQELKLFYSVQFNNEERYFWNVDLFECIDDYRSGVIEKYYKDIINEREERREGYWKRHPDVYQLYKQRYIDTCKRYKKKLQEKKSHIEYIEKNKLDILEESDLNKIQQEFQKMKKSKIQQMRNSQIIDNNSQNNKTKRLSSKSSSVHT